MTVEAWSTRSRDSAGAPGKKLVYVLNYVSADDTQHFVHVFHLLKRLSVQHGWSVVLLSEKGGLGVQNLFGLEVRYLSHRGGLIRLLRLARQLLALRREGHRLVFVRITKPPAVISALLGPLLGMRSLYWQSGTVRDFDRGRPFRHRAFDDLMMWVITRMSSAFVTGPESMVGYYRQHYGVADSKLRLLYNDIDLDRFRPAEIGRREQVRILFVHRFSPVRRSLFYFPAIIDRLNRAAAAGHNVVLEMIGDGPEREMLVQQSAAAAEGVTVNFRGSVANRDLPDHYAAADIFIMPTYREGMPRALMEAMASGLPMVSTDAGGSADMVGPRQREFVVSRDDPEAFADRLFDLIGDASTRRQIGEENRKWVARYSTDAAAEMFDALLRAELERLR